MRASSNTTAAGRPATLAHEDLAHDTAVTVLRAVSTFTALATVACC